MCLTKHVPVGFLLWLFIGVWRTHAFATVLRYERETCLSALGKAQNKQAELARKLELAKKQQREGVDDESNPVDEMKEQMEHERFEFAQLLAKNIQAPIQREKTFTKTEIPSIPSNRPKAKSKSVKRRKKHSIEEENPVELSEKQPLKEGDVAKRRHFEPLVSVATKQPMGPMAAAQLVPWVPPYLSTYMIVLADPRKQSPELRSVLQILASNIAPNVLSQVVAISADLPEETAAWLRRVSMNDTPMRMFSDPKLEWMKMYSADEGRWSVTVYAFGTDGVIQRLHREVDPSQATRLVEEIVHSMEEELI